MLLGVLVGVCVVVGEGLAPGVSLTDGVGVCEFVGVLVGVSVGVVEGLAPGV